MLKSLSKELSPQIIHLAMKLASIPSPSGCEMDKSHFIRDWFVAQCAIMPDIDEIGNVTVEINGVPGQITQLYLAHIDTVFARVGTITPKIEGNCVFAPSIGDNSCNVAALMLTAKAFIDSKRTPHENRIIAFNVGEEGLGNLLGARALMQRYEGRLDQVIAIDATTGAVIDQAVGSLRYRVEVKTPGGHSYSAFGNPSAIHHAANIVQQLYSMRVPKIPKTTFNVGVIEGGTSINTIAQSCSMFIDLRSSDSDCLEALNQRATDIIRAQSGTGVEVVLTCIGERPCGQPVSDTSLIERILAIRKDIGLPLCRAAGSTDCNLSLARGIPSICFGVYRGHGAHTMEEYLYADSIETGLLQLLYLFFNVDP